MSKSTKPFVIDGDEFASVCHYMSGDGPLIIDVMMNTLTPAQARRLSEWLVRAANEVERDKRKRCLARRRERGKR